MRIQIEFELSGKNQFLPFNYQYPVSSWIYKVLSRGDQEFANFLHNKGYVTKHTKEFKLFTFSQLRFPKGTWRLSEKHRDRLQIKSRKAWIDISFHLPEQLNPFVMGLFQDQHVTIGDSFSRIEMKVKNVESKASPIKDTNGNLNFRSKTGVVMGFEHEEKKHEEYIHPLHSEYYRLMLGNLLDKCKAANLDHIKEEDLVFKIGKVSSKVSLQRIKADTPAETKVKAFHFDFELQAPEEVLNLVYDCGIGSMNSLGFGMCEIVKNK